MIIILTNNAVFGEPGPNFCWFGSPDEFGVMASMLDKICEGELSEVAITSSDTIHLFGFKTIIFSVSECGNELVRNCSNGIIKSNLSKNLWKRFRLNLRALMN